MPYTASQTAPDHLKKVLNQALVERILITCDDDSPGGVPIRAELREPFHTLLGTEMQQMESHWRLHLKANQAKTKRCSARSRTAFS
jgi:hypothetical protein